MRRDLVETIVGALVIVAAVGFLVYVNQASGVANQSGGFELTASFRKAGGLSPGSEVRLAGVRIGSVREIQIDYERYRADVRFQIAGTAKIPEDSSAEIQAEGLFGGTYISIVPGASTEFLGPGDSFEITRGSVDFLDLLGKAVGSGAR